ncbi:MAG: MFS transporter, partial [Anaerolineae bacterium]|jgi:MFS family permease|nr:MFS transporter [Anaerolineae bacterium]
MDANLTAGGLLTWIFLTDGVRDVAFSMSFQLMPIYLEEFGSLSIQQIGWLHSIFGACYMAMSIPAGALADKTSERLAIAAGFAVQFVALLVFLYAGSFWGFAASWALFGIGVALMAPAYQALISKVVPDHLRGTAFGVLRSSLGVFSLPAPAIGAQLWERVSPRFPFQITAGAVLLSVIPVWLKFKLPRAEDKGQDSQVADPDSDSVLTTHDS